MADQFNPWHTWLGIPVEEQPANHYRLLGIQQFEDNPTVIENAADQRMMLLRSFQTGKRGGLSQTLLNEVATARACLLNPERKAAYDDELLKTRSFAAQANGASLFPTESLPQIRVESVRAYTNQPAKPHSLGSSTTRPIKSAVVGSGVALFLVIGTAVGAAFALRSKPPDPVATETSGGSPIVERHSSGQPPSVTPAPKPQPCLVLRWPAADRLDAQVDIGGATLDLTKAQDPRHPVELRFSVAPGQHTVRIVRRGFETFRQTVLVEHGKDTTVVPIWKANEVAVVPPPVAKPPENPKPEPKQLPPLQVAEQPATALQPGLDERAVVQRVDPPSADEQQKLLPLIDEVYKPGDAKDPPAKVALSRKLLTDGLKNGDKRNEQYVLLRRASEIALEAGDPNLMLEAVDAMVTVGFNVRLFQLKARLLEQLAKQEFLGGAGQLAAVVASCVSFVEEAAVAGALDEADRVLAAARGAVVEQGKQAQKTLRVARVAVGRARNLADKSAQEKKVAAAQTEVETSEVAKSTLDECASMFQQLGREYQAFKTAQERLMSEPDHAESNLAVGEFLCFVQGDWAKGLPHLSRGTNAELTALAEQEISSPPTDPVEQTKLADRWWDFAQTAKHRRKETILLHAGFWYEHATQGELVGLSKSKVGTRLAEIAKIGRPLSGELLARRGPQLPTIVFGKWFPLLTSPDVLVGWDGVDSRVRYGNRLLETPSRKSILYPIVTRDSSIRAKVKKGAGQNIGLTLRRSEKGGYFAWFNGGRWFGIAKTVDGKWTDLKHGHSPQACDDFFEFGFSAIGDELTLFVNGQPVVQVRDTSHVDGTATFGGAGSGVFTDIEMFIPSKESLVADDRKPSTSSTEPQK